MDQYEHVYIALGRLHHARQFRTRIAAEQVKC